MYQALSVAVWNTASDLIIKLQQQKTQILQQTLGYP